MDTVKCTLQSSINLKLYFGSSQMHFFYLVHRLGVSMELSTTLTLATRRLATSHHTECHH